MQYYRCRCGLAEAWGSYAPYKCEGCNECKTTLEAYPELHTTPAEHTWMTKYHQDDGKPYEVCKVCCKPKRNEVNG